MGYFYSHSLIVCRFVVDCDSVTSTSVSVSVSMPIPPIVHCECVTSHGEHHCVHTVTHHFVGSAWQNPFDCLHFFHIHFVSDLSVFFQRFHYTVCVLKKK